MSLNNLNQALMVSIAMIILFLIGYLSSKKDNTEENKKVKNEN